MKKSRNDAITNKKAIWIMLMIMFAIMVIVMAIFWFFESRELENRAKKAIRQTMVSETYEDRSLPPVYEFYTEEGKEGILNVAETELVNFYNENRKGYSFGEVYLYARDGRYIYFCPLNAARRGDSFVSEDECLLLYTDVSYSVHVLHASLFVMVILLAVSMLLLFLVSRHILKLLDQKDMGMKNFFANASHELKTPLMAIRGNVDGIRNGYVTSEKGCDIIDRETERMSDLIGSILDLSKLDSGTVRPDITKNDIREIVYDAAGIILPEAEQKDIRVTIDAPESVFFPCDEGMLFSAFSNILTNAMRYAEHEISIQIDKQDKTTIRFINDGKPISEEDKVHIFDRFYKGEKGQTGIGMALAQEYVRMHGSEIRVSVHDERTLFEIILPKTGGKSI